VGGRVGVGTGVRYTGEPVRTLTTLARRTRVFPLNWGTEMPDFPRGGSHHAINYSVLRYISIYSRDNPHHDIVSKTPL
jgi:hypothetical protein